MLNKNNKILIGCLALLLAMSVGYALFSDTITINGTATAKGDFELTTTCKLAEDNAILGSVTEEKILCDDNIVNASATLGYPGSEVMFDIMVTNTGTIPARLKQVENIIGSESIIINKDNLGDVIKEVTNTNNTNSAFITLISSKSWQDDYSGTDVGYVQDAPFEKAQFEAVLDPGETAYFYVVAGWYEASTESGDVLTPTINAKLTWEQITN